MTTTNEILKVQNLSKSFGSLNVLKDISFTVNKGDVLGIIGPSGSGKSTLLRTVCQLESVTGGSITVCGQPLVKDGIYSDKAALRKIALNVGLVFQNFNLSHTFPFCATLLRHSGLSLAKARKRQSL